MNPWFGIGLVLATLVTVILTLRWYKQRYSPHPEWTRKLLHVSMGLTTLSFPWLFEQNWPVLLLAAITVPGLWALRRSARLKAQIGNIICGVERQQQSLGEIYFPLGVAGLFVLSGGNPLRYTIPLLLLTLADAVAALIGMRFGRTRYTTAEGHKSAEGSLAFFIVAFFSVHVPLLFFGDIPPGESLLIALILGLLVMLVEAIAWRGLDNLLVPVVGFLLLNTFLDMSMSQLVGRLILTVALVSFTMLWRRHANLHDSALLGAAFLGYLIWTLADWRWFVGPLIVFAGHVVLVSGPNWPDFRSAPKANAGPPYNIYAVLSVAAGGLLWLLLYQITSRPEFLYPFSLAFAAQLALLIMVAQKHSPQQTPTIFRLAGSIVTGWLLIFIPFLFIEQATGPALRYSLLAVLGVGLAALAFYWVQPVLHRYPTNSARWLKQAGCALLGSMVGLLPLYII